MRGFLLATLLFSTAAASGGNTSPRTRCSTCSILPPGTVGVDLTLNSLTFNGTGVVQSFPLNTCVSFSGSAVGSACSAGAAEFFNDGANMCFRVNSTNRTCWNQGSGNMTNLFSFESTVGNGSKAFQADTNGAIWDFGAGSTDDASSDGTTVTFRGPVASAGNITSAGFFNSTVAGGNTAYSMNDLARVAWSNTSLTGNGNVVTISSNGNGVATFDRAAGMTVSSPAGSATYFPAGTLFSSQASTGNGGTCASNVDLIAYTLPASTLNITNRCLRIKAYGTTANNATAKNIDVSVGASVLVTKALTVSIAGTWDVSAVVCRTGASAQTSWAEAFNNGGTTVSSTDGATVLKNTSFTTPAFTETVTQSIRVRCITNANAANDIVEKGMTVEIL